MLDVEAAIKVREVMTPDSVCCVPEDAALQMAKTPCDRNIGSMTVIADLQSRKLVGIITDRDLCCSIIARGLDPKTTSILPFMQLSPAICRDREQPWQKSRGRGQAAA
jgi:signal-transduction protein with cAMP-binding, CBS, and nucleotidyltransferase domain